MITPSILSTLLKKAKKIRITYKVAAMAFSKKGEVLGSVTCCAKMDNRPNKKGSGIHAERRLISRYGDAIKTILIIRVGHSGEILPIAPCDVCKKVADKMGIKIVSVLGKEPLDKSVKL